MVKRKKIGLCPAEDEKHQDEGMTLLALPENEKPTENAQESQSNNVCQQTNTVRNRIHVTRTATKETQGPSELNTSLENPAAEKIAKALTVQRSSNRVAKRPLKDGSPVTTLKKADVGRCSRGHFNFRGQKLESLKQTTPADGSKTRRPWELWSVEDKNAFFEALCEYGKDFENIQSYIAQRSKKKGVPANMIKNKDQVRHFYYRTWHKISKYLEIGEDVRKQAQELYGLINYAELRKKIGGGLNEKNSQKLNELVFHGVTTVKYKGKKLRIKTPVCRALKKLNNVAEAKEPVVEKFLKEITVEFRPCTNEAWLHVQNLAQNPRVRTKLYLQRRLKSVIEYLEKRWKPQRLKKKEQVVSGLPSSSLPPAESDPPPVLRVRPKSGSAVSSLTIAAVDNASSSDVCLQKYMKRFVRDGGNSEFLKGKKGRLKPKPQVTNSACLLSEKTPENNVAETELQPNLEPCVNKTSEELPVDSVGKDDKNSMDEPFSVGILTPPKSVPEQDDQNENPVNEAERSLSLLKSMLYPVEDKLGEVLSEQTVEVCSTNQDIEGGNACAPECKTIEEMYLSSQQDTENLTLGQLLGMGAEKQLPSPEPDVEQTEPSCANSDCNKELITDPKSYDSGDISNQHKAECPVTSFEEVITKGWSVEDAGLLTIGELYLMLGKPAKIMLEYEWEYPKRPEKNVSTAPPGEHNSAKVTSPDNSQSKLSEVLGRLLQIASTTFAEFKNKQQTPLSPTSRGGGNLRTNSSASPHTKSTSRGAPKHSATKASLKTKCSNSEKTVKESTNITSKSSDVKSSVLDSPGTPTEIGSTNSTTVATTHASDNLVPTPSEKNVFVVPVGAAPRTVKQPTQESLREEIDKLLPGTRRGCRVRRKPLVVQRTLLPREGMSAVSRPMTVVHLVPSGSQLSSLAAVIPSNCPSSENKIALPSTKKVVKILSAGPTLDVRPLQVPIINAVSTDANRNVLLQPTSLSTPHLVMTPASSKTVNMLDNQHLSPSLPPSISTASVATINVSSDRPILMQPSVNPQPTVIVSSPSQSSIVTSLTLSSLNNTTNQPVHVISASKTVTSSVPTISIPYTSCTSASAVSPTSVSSLMEMSLSEGLPAEPISELAGEQLLDFGENSNLSVSFGLPSVKPAQSSSSISTSLSIDPATPCKTTTSPQISPGRNFRISSPGPEAQWMNGESVEVSLNTLLNTLETPCKVLPASCTVSSSTDNSNLDPIVRLAPVVDSQVRCLLDECSVDFIAKFEDLADVINSPATESKQT